jgi:hypothetical protein
MFAASLEAVKHFLGLLVAELMQRIKTTADTSVVYVAYVFVRFSVTLNKIVVHLALVVRHLHVLKNPLDVVLVHAFVIHRLWEALIVLKHELWVIFIFV